MPANDTNVNGSLNNAELLKAILDIKDGMADLRGDLSKMNGTFTEKCAGVEKDVMCLDERLKLIERRWLPVLTSIRAKLIFIPTAILFVLASISYVVKIATWLLVKIGH